MKGYKIALKIILIGAFIVSFEFAGVLNSKVFAEENTLENNTSVENTNNTSTNETENTNTNTDADTNTTPETPTQPVVPAKINISKLKLVANTSTYSYTGGYRNPSAALYNAGKKLIVNKDYKITYKNNINPGRGSYTIQGIGNYTGTITKYYYIAPAKAKIKKVKFNSDATKATITWKKDPKASGYRIYMATSKNGTYKRIKTVESKNITSYTKKGLKLSKEYYFKVRAYKQYGDKRIVKKYSEPKTGGKLLSKVSFTAHGSGANRKYNLAKACNTISGLVLDPGERFNWFKVIGPASGSRGYKMASVYKNGKVTKGYGGGVCQVSTTVYQGALKAGLKIIERHIHSLPVTYIKHGNDATVSYGVQNLIFKNTKKYPIKIIMYAEGETTSCKIYSLVN